MSLREGVASQVGLIELSQSSKQSGESCSLRRSDSTRACETEGMAVGKQRRALAGRSHASVGKERRRHVQGRLV